MAAKKIAAAKKLNDLLHVHFRKSQKKVLFQAAKIRGMSAGEVIREAVGDWLAAHAEAPVAAASAEQ